MPLPLHRHRPSDQPVESADSADESIPNEIALLGAHGGAGTSTLAFLLRSDLDLGAAREPHLDAWDYRMQGRPLVLVTRNNAPAAVRAEAVVNALAGRGIHVAVLAVISDGLPEPCTASYRFRVLSSRVGWVVRVPFVGMLRTTEDPAPARLPFGAHRAVARIEVAALYGSVATT
jgi:hypothetical protein